MAIIIVATIGVAVTLYALVRLLLALRRHEGREVVRGWFAVMIAAAIFVFVADRVLSI